MPTSTVFYTSAAPPSSTRGIGIRDFSSYYASHPLHVPTSASRLSSTVPARLLRVDRLCSIGYRSTIGSGSFDRGLAVRTSSGANSSVGVFARISGLNDRRVISFPGRAADSVADSVADIAAGSVAAW